MAFIHRSAVKKSIKLPLVIACYLLLWPAIALASNYKEALEAYSDQKFAKAYRMAMELAESNEGNRRARSLVLAAVSALELNKEEKASKLYRAALAIEAEIELPDIVKSKRVIKFFADVKAGKSEQKPLKGQIVEVVSKTASDATDIETYLPFGINQMAQGKPVTAIILGGAQIASIYYAFDLTRNATRVEQKLQQKTAEVIESGDYETTEFRDFRTRSEKSIKISRQTANIALGVAFASYTASVLEIILNPPIELKVVDGSPKPPTISWRLGMSGDGDWFMGFAKSL